MSLVILDGKGGRAELGVDAHNRALVNAQINHTGHFVSHREGLAFNTVSVIASAAAGNIVFYFKNTSTDRLFFVDLMRVGAANAALWKVFEATGTAAGGSALTPVNVNLTSGVSAAATARGDGSITGTTAGNLIAVGRNPTGAHADIPFDDILILGTNDAITVEYDTGTTGAAEVLMRGFYQKSSEVD